MLLKYHL